MTTFQKLDRLNNSDWRCLNVADGFGYYMYLPHLFQKGSLVMTKEWAQGVQDKHCEGCVAYQLILRKNGNEINMYQMGLSYVFLPSYIIADSTARMSGYEADGFSTPYHVVFFLNALLFIFLGLLYLRKLLLLFVSDRVAGITALLLYLGTNVFVTFDSQIDMPHMYLFTLNAIFLYHLFKFKATKKHRSLLYAALFFGLTTSIRPTQALLGLLPLIVLYKEYGNVKQFWKSILLFPLMALLWNIPQILYWKIVGGELVTLNLHTEDIVVTDPYLFDFLFSYRKGWFVYSPLFLLIFLGFYKTYSLNRTLFWSTLSSSVVYIYILSSWETWYYAQSFGSRVMVDIYPILILPIAIGLASLRKKVVIGAIGGFALLCVSLNLFQSYQFHKGFLHVERMTKEHYWYIFGKADFEHYDQSRLLINRSNLAWLNYQKEHTSPHRYIVSREIFTLDSPIKSIPTHDITVGRISVIELTQTDETMFEVHVTVKTSDRSQSSLLRMECVSLYNVYSWNNYEVSQVLPENNEYQELVFKFNLPEIRHKADEMQLYLDNDANVSVDIKEMKIIAHSLIRQ